MTRRDGRTAEVMDLLRLESIRGVRAGLSKDGNPLSVPTRVPLSGPTRFQVSQLHQGKKKIVVFRYLFALKFFKTFDNFLG